jgi:hypothetical protein
MDVWPYYKAIHFLHKYGRVVILEDDRFTRNVRARISDGSGE